MTGMLQALLPAGLSPEDLIILMSGVTAFDSFFAVWNAARPVASLFYGAHVRHVAALRSIDAALARSHELTASGAAPELTAVELNDATLALGTITGETTPEDVLADTDRVMRTLPPLDMSIPLEGNQQRNEFSAGVLPAPPATGCVRQKTFDGRKHIDIIPVLFIHTGMFRCGN